MALQWTGGEVGKARPVGGRPANSPARPRNGSFGPFGCLKMLFFSTQLHTHERSFFIRVNVMEKGTEELSPVAAAK